MGRIRTIKPEFAESQSMGRVSRDARLLFVLLWTVVDDHGRTRGHSRALARRLFPYDDDAADHSEGWFKELEDVGCIRRYQVNGDDYLEVIHWTDHQKIDRRSGPKFPGWDERDAVSLPDTREPSPSPREEKAPDQGPRTKEQGPKDQGSRTKEQGPRTTLSCSPSASDFDRWWEVYPRKVGKGKAQTAYAKAVKKVDPLVLLDAAQAFAVAWANPPPDQERFIPHPATWLNQERWSDDRTDWGPQSANRQETLEQRNLAALADYRASRAVNGREVSSGS